MRRLLLISAAVGLTATALSPAGCSRGRTEPSPVSSLAGAWRLGDVVEGVPGIRLELEIDSVRERRVHGHVVAYLSGDVGVPGDRFAPFTGTIDDSVVAMSIARAEGGAVAIVIHGILRGDSAAVTLLVLGPDTLPAEPRRFLIKAPPRY